MGTFKILLLSGVLAGLFLSAGCINLNPPLDQPIKSDPGQKTGQSAMKQFQDATPEGPSAVESAIEMSKKYAALSEEMSQLKVEKQTLAAENSRLVPQITVLEKELAQTKKELSEANDLLIEMRIELNNWKTDVLGFRDEMRQADKAQLETLMKILKVLGGDVPSGTSSGKN